MPNMALVIGAETRIIGLEAQIDGYTNRTHRLESLTGGEPVEDGRDVTDHVVAKPRSLSLTAIVSDFEGGQRPAEAWATITRLQQSSEPFQVITEYETIDEMVIRRCEGATQGRGLRLDMELEEILRVGTPIGGTPPAALSGVALNRGGVSDRGRVRLGEQFALTG